MLNKRVIKIIFICLIAPVFLIESAHCRTEYDYIDINNPFIRKIPIAVPLFKSMSGSEKEKVLSKEASNLLSRSLEFTGYFKIIDRDAYLADPKTDTIGSNINFKNWTGIGAELLITGSLFLKDNVIEMELRLYDTFKGLLIVGKRYKGVVNNQRKMIHRFCGEIIYKLTGNRGIFDSKIAFVSSGSGNKNIYLCEFDGHNSEQLTYNKSITLSPAWSSDAKWIAYTSYSKGKPDLYIKNLKDKHGAVVAKKGINISPAWVPGKFQLAATLSFSGDPEIYLLTGKGEIVKNLTNNWGIDVSPTFSPDGKKMAFVSSRSGFPQIYIMDLDSGQVKRLTFQGRYNTSPSWSPRGDKIAYSGMENGQINIYTIDVKGEGLTVQLTQNSGNNESPTWSPDGSLIAFSSTREGPSRIYVMTAYGTDQRRLLALPGEQTNPEWSPGVIDN
ncbi:MAG: Tol-Pal system beta propeller repeat protein TolB [Proteobacteria bacterium]|nr:Tol-Pal system beta propeller repeat protein TolB [Pseudomonadota bacterium]MBU4287304.1 Tol-Pal system beta propeller repeat protein TolB [Pseudomonadota bacterium]MBU4413750.1 Tol-Pal system beta propeller repeat protein TolB [Pseudomonadota bacterium]MCG2757417.1 Tol-Pal system beta propeller repeat protein TolB [Desulfobacteraceae bacterium]